MDVGAIHRLIILYCKSMVPSVHLNNNLVKWIPSPPIRESYYFSHCIPLCASSTKCFNQMERNSTVINGSSLNNITRSKSKSSDISSTTMNSNSSKQSSLKLPKNFTKNSILEQSSLKLPENSIKSSILEQSSLKLSINSTKSCDKQTPLSESNVKDLQQKKPVKGKSTKKTKITKSNLKDKVANKLKKGKRRNSPRSDIFGSMDFDSFGDTNYINILSSPGVLSVLSGSEMSSCDSPPSFGHRWSLTDKSLVVSEPPTPLGKLVEAKALKRINPPKITMDEELKKNKKINKQVDFKTAVNKINKLLQFGGQDNDY